MNNLKDNNVFRKINFTLINSFLRQITPPFFINIYKKISKKILTKNTYKIGEYILKIPKNCTLPLNQKKFKLYDRFLPILSKNFPKNKKIVIDVGANIGDTTIAMIQNCTNIFFCFEPSDIFFSYLEENIKNLKKEDTNRIKIFKKLVGTGMIKGELVHATNCTANIKINSDKKKFLNPEKLDDVINNKEEILLLKVDTDGFDFDIINSAKKILSESEPVLYWENEISEKFQYEGFNKMYSLLEKNNYKYIYIFDNYGNLITEENNFETLKNINSYLYNIKKNNYIKTFYYTDILASTEKNISFVKKAIDEYKNNVFKIN